MGKYVINGGRKLSGKITVQSAKNSVMPMMAGSLLTDDPVVIKKCPKIADVFSMLNILKSLGTVAFFENDDLVIMPKYTKSNKTEKNQAKALRSSIFLMGALVSRFKKAEISLPGGCDIGERPIDIHVDLLKSMGCEISQTTDGINCVGNKLKCCEFRLPFASVGATENAILAAVKLNGTTVLKNVAREPEIIDLVCFLRSMGAKIYGEGTKTIQIEGVKKLRGTEYQPIGDRVEAGTFLTAVAISGGELEIKGINSENISSLIHKLCENSCKITVKNDIIYIKSGKTRKPFSLVTGPYPLFATDLQAQAMTLACLSEGQSVIRENVFENRFRHVEELKKFGADIKVYGRAAVINGVKEFIPANVYAKDLRGGASLVLGALNAKGSSTVFDVYHIERGYADFDLKLRSIGADITKIN
ncbi:MAG: UDP-N-acetylglucosamine 1-carboxyvinyltransferase [Clostridia bacterium]|nr:UDP-N-acetylglucosamine 1-carboxyvinyltransferase [Clostridia bacterium]